MVAQVSAQRFPHTCRLLHPFNLRRQCTSCICNKEQEEEGEG